MEGILILLMRSAREKGSDFASLNVLGFNNGSEISVSSMLRNSIVFLHFMRFCTYGWFPVDRGIMSKGLRLFQSWKHSKNLSPST